MLRTIIIGFGFAGLHLHYRCLKKMLVMGWENVLHPEITAVDNSDLAYANAQGKAVQLREQLEPISSRESEHYIVHVCSPPSFHLENLKAALERGYRQIIVEKPVVSTKEELGQIQALQNYYGANILVVANWICSALVDKIRTKLKDNAWGDITRLNVVQNKSRFSRSLERSDEHVFDIEMPHQVSLALYMNGPAQPVAAMVTDMLIPNHVIPKMGTGDVILQHSNGAMSELRSSLIHTSRERYIEIETLSGYRMKGYFPCGGDDSYSQLSVFDPDGAEFCKELIYDDPLTLCFIRAYRYFLKCRQFPEAPRPQGMDLKFNQMKVEILEKSKQLANYKPVQTRFAEIHGQQQPRKNGVTINANTLL